MADETRDARAVRKLPEFTEMKEQVLEAVLSEGRVVPEPATKTA